jgi:hypothetical protein
MSGHQYAVDPCADGEIPDPHQYDDAARQNVIKTSSNIDGLSHQYVDVKLLGPGSEPWQAAKRRWWRI